MRARVAVGAGQHLSALHDAIQEAFGWFDDHLYSFWLNGEFYGGEEFEHTSPEIPNEGSRTGVARSSPTKQSQATTSP